LDSVSWPQVGYSIRVWARITDDNSPIISEYFRRIPMQILKFYDVHYSAVDVVSRWILTVRERSVQFQPSSTLAGGGVTERFPVTWACFRWRFLVWRTGYLDELRLDRVKTRPHVFSMDYIGLSLIQTIPVHFHRSDSKLEVVSWTVVTWWWWVVEVWCDLIKAASLWSILSMANQRAAFESRDHAHGSGGWVKVVVLVRQIDVASDCGK